MSVSNQSPPEGVAVVFHHHRPHYTSGGVYKAVVFTSTKVVSPLKVAAIQFPKGRCLIIGFELYTIGLINIYGEGQGWG